MSFIGKSAKKKGKLIVIISVVILCLAFGGVGLVKYTNAAQVKEGIVLGNKYLQEDKYEEAILNFIKVIKIEPQNIEARLGLAKAYIKAGKSDESEKVLKETIGMNPKKVEPYLESAKLYIFENNPVGAIKILTDGYKATNDENIKSVLEDLKSKITVDNIDESITLGENFSLPKEVPVKINNVEVQVPVRWNETLVDTTKVGINVFNGTLENISNKIKLTINVTGIASIENINSTINQNDKFSLPSKVTAKITDGSTREVQVKWNATNIDTSNVGNYSYDGNVNGYNSKVKLKLSVEKLYIKGEETDVFVRLINDLSWQKKNEIIFLDNESTIDDYFFVDLDQDGVNEMLIHHGSCEADKTESVVTYNNGNIKIQHLPIGHGGYGGYSKSTKVFILSHMHMGYAGSIGYKLVNGLCQQVFESNDDVATGVENPTYSVNGKKVSKEEHDRAFAGLGLLE